MKKYVPLFEEFMAFPERDNLNKIAEGFSAFNRQLLVNEGLFGSNRFKEVELIVPTTGEYAQLRELAKKKGGKLKVAFLTDIIGKPTIDDTVGNGVKIMDEALKKGYYCLYPVSYLKTGAEYPEKIEFRDITVRKGIDDERRMSTFYVEADMFMPMKKFFEENNDKFGLNDDIERIAAVRKIGKEIVDSAAKNVCKTGATGECHSILEADAETVKKFAKQSERGFKTMFNTRELLQEGSPYCKGNAVFDSKSIVGEAVGAFKGNAERYMRKHAELLEKFPYFKQFCAFLAKTAVVE